MKYHDIIIIICILILLYKLITFNKKLSIPRIIVVLGLVMSGVVVLFDRYLSVFELYFLWLFWTGISIVAIYFLPKYEEHPKNNNYKYCNSFKTLLWCWLFLVGLGLALYII